MLIVFLKFSEKGFIAFAQFKEMMNSDRMRPVQSFKV